MRRAGTTISPSRQLHVSFAVSYSRMAGTLCFSNARRKTALLNIGRNLISFSTAPGRARSRFRFRIQGMPRISFGPTTSWRLPTLGVLPVAVSRTSSFQVAGDGAFQEFLRIAFPRKTAADVYDLLIPQADARAEIERKIFAAEDAFRRAWVWSEDPRLDCEILQKLHEEHLAGCEERQRRSAHDCPNPGRLDNVSVFHSCDHFSVCYAFNHFLALLVNELAGGKHFAAQRRLRSVMSADPATNAVFKLLIAGSIAMRSNFPKAFVARIRRTSTNPPFTILWSCATVRGRTLRSWLVRSFLILPSGANLSVQAGRLNSWDAKELPDGWRAGYSQFRQIYLDLITG